MKKYDVHYSVNCGLKSGNNNPILTDMWKTETIKAESKEKAIEEVVKIELRDDNKVNYILSCKEI